jgi:hypothetical protein
MKAFYTTALVSLALFLLPAAAREKEDRLLDVRIVGSSSGRPEPSVGTVTGIRAVQKLLLGLTAAPCPMAEVDLTLQGTGLTGKDLVKLQLIRREKDRYVLGFPVYSAADVRKIRAVTGRYATSLADALLARRKEIEAALPACCAPGVDRRDVAFLVLGCVSLDWDGLALAAKKHYRTMEKRPDGRYGAWAQEKSDPTTTDRIYWSSGTLSYGDALLASFGDGHARYLSALRSPPAPLKAPKVFPYATKCLLALRDGDRSLDELRLALGITTPEVRSLAELLVGVEFVTLQDGRYQAHIPVFSRGDRKALQQLRRIGNEVMTQWLADNYKKLKADLSFTAPAHQGVPYSEEFNAIWHYVFGCANRHLVEAGLCGDPYAPPRRYQGDIPAVFENGVL